MFSCRDQGGELFFLTLSIIGARSLCHVGMCPLTLPGRVLFLDRVSEQEGESDPGGGGGRH